MEEPSAVLDRDFEQPAAGNQVFQHAPQSRNVEHRGEVRHTRDRFLVVKAVDLPPAAALGHPRNTAFSGTVIIVVIEVNRRHDILVFEDALTHHLLDRTKGSDGGCVRKPLHGCDAMLFQNALYAADRVAFAVKKTTNSPQQVDVVGPVVSAAPASLHRLYLGEPCLPEPQDVLRNVEIVSDLADGSEGIRRFVQMLAPLSLAPMKNRGYAGLAPLVPAPWPLIRCFKIADGLNTITRRGEIGTS